MDDTPGQIVPVRAGLGDFDRDFDIRINKLSPSTIDPTFLGSLRDPLCSTSISTLPAGPFFSLSGVLSPPSEMSPCSEMSPYSEMSPSNDVSSLPGETLSPSASPKYMDSTTLWTAFFELVDMGLLTDEELINELRSSLSGGTGPSQEVDATSAPLNICTQSSLLPQSAGVPPAYPYPPSNYTGSEQPQQRHFGAAVADAYSQGTSMQVIAFTEGDHSQTNETPSRTHPVSTDALDPPVTPSSSKHFPCSRPYCRGGFDTKYNLREHIAKVHDKLRPFLCDVKGCPKASKGYSRKYDLQVHRNKKHPQLLSFDSTALGLFITGVAPL
ncbi:hypothetical protein BC628DRAFT_1400101 [Trametes gibbosa]|uniref:C2H2-type domain-containing protein n=1 Tax=Trametes gibbosa TaxID=160864 RepID=A0A6G6FQ60_9APHY|nr:hypothetical protein BC628DRAFT_1400101 [Trametes gibbosa]QIE48429.1 hypothetical protein [Trametes gibbosa]